MAILTRRGFFKIISAISLSSSISKSLKASSKSTLSPDRKGVLVDTSVCIGCRNCEWACKNAHDIPTESVDAYDDKTVFQKLRRPDVNSLTVVNSFSSSENEFAFVKSQCMHCDHPACVSACIVGAFTKDESGSVSWDTDKCIGCRYCMVACPFQIPAFEFHNPLKPDIVKCDFCKTRTEEGKLPACVDICPVEALTYGTRKELLQVALEKIRRHPERYHQHIFGEYEAGGTSWLYIGKKNMTELGFPTVGNSPAPGVSESIQHGIFAYFVPPVSLYALLGGIMWLLKKREDTDEE